MFEGFSQAARRAVVRAQHEAIRARDDHIGSEHLLLGLLSEPGPAAEALTAAWLDLAQPRPPQGSRTSGRTAPRAGPLPAACVTPAQGRPRQSSGTWGRTAPLDAEALASLGIDLDAVRRA